MKPYFVKHLLEEGKLKDKDYFLWKDEIHQFHSDAGYGIKTYTQYNPEDGSSLLVNWSNCRGKIKFVLCSRNIKIGDEFTFPNGEKDIIDHFESILPLGIMVGKNPNNFIHCCDERCFKIIGDISPDAYPFIQENQEFDEEEVKKVCYLTSGEKSWGGYAGIDDVLGNHLKSNSNYRTGYIIKCPCCKKFN